MKKNYLIYLFLLVFASCASKQTGTYTKQENGITILLKNEGSQTPQQVRLQVVSEKIIRVSASAEKEFSSEKSLSVVDKEASNCKWTVEEKKGSLLLKTGKLQAEVDLSNGAVSFMDSTGKVLTKEKGIAPKKLIPVTIKNHKLYKTYQEFDATEDEALYGMGQHQDGIVNFKGADLTLAQYNTNVAVPFIVSNRNYGILWDNYSITKIGDSTSFKPISMFKLYDEKGNAGGLTAKYSSKFDKSKVTTRVEDKIDYEFIPLLEQRPKGFALDSGIVTWEGSIEADSVGAYRFSMMHAGYCKVWLDGKMIVDNWRQCWNAGSSVFSLEMSKGKKYPIKIEWIPDGVESYIALKALKPKSKEAFNTLSICSEASSQLDYYFVYGQNSDDVIAGYREITGKANIVPKWALGFWQSRERYKTQDDVLNTIKEFRSRRIPIDNIVMDWFYWQKDKWGTHQFDKERFSNPDQMIKDLHEKYNTNFMISVWPKFYVGTDNYDKMQSKGWLYTKNVENKQKDWIGYVSTFYDPFTPQARELFWNMLSERLFSKGVDAWWMDASEPDIHSNLSPEMRKDLMEPMYEGPAAKYFNAFPLQNAKGIYEGQRKEKNDQRVFILTRSAFAGLQRYSAATWSGDISARWHDLKRQISAGINFALSGLPYWTTDIGGFAVEKRYETGAPEHVEEFRELQMRWYQFGAFCPLFRSHGQLPLREIFNIAPESHPAYQSMLYYNKLRYQLMPYIYSLAGKTYFDNYTIMRGLVMDFVSDKNVLNIADQFMFGPSILVNPVTDFKATKRKLYLPAGCNWYDFYTGKPISGGKTIDADAPYTRMPLYIKEGTILPLGPEIQYTGEKPADPITLVVYTGKNGSFELYEDENINYNYEKGKFTKIPFQYDEKSKTLTIGDRVGSFDKMLTNRTFNIVWVSATKNVGQSFDMKPDQVVKYDGKAVSVSMK